MGGGVETQVPLTADLFARAIIAAALAFGDDPVVSATTTARHRRRALVAAAGGLAAAEVCTLNRAAKILGVAPTSVSTARNMNRSGYREAERAAMRAAEYATWQPEAAESVAGGAELDDVEAEPAAEPALRIPVELDEPELPAPPARAPIPIRTAAEGLMALRGHTPKPPIAGAITAPIRPAWPAQPSPVKPAERPVRELVLEALRDADGPLSSMSLAAIVDRKEMPVASTLSTLASEGLVESVPLSTGPRKLAWRLTKKALAA